MKLVEGEPGELCHHGKPITALCRECRTTKEEEMQKDIDELKRKIKDKGRKNG